MQLRTAREKKRIRAVSIHSAESASSAAWQLFPFPASESRGNRYGFDVVNLMLFNESMFSVSGEAPAGN